MIRPRQLTWIFVILTLAGCSRAPGPQQPAAGPAAGPAASATTTAAGGSSMGAMPHAPTTLDEWAHGAQLFDGLGSSHRKISTTSPEAQQYFDQGLRLMWAF